MAKFRVKELSFIGNHLWSEGCIVEYNGEVSDNLERVPDETPLTNPQDSKGMQPKAVP